MPSPAEALAALPDAGVTDVVLVSLQTIPGHEYNDLLRTAAAFSGLAQGPPSGHGERAPAFRPGRLPKAAKALLDSLPKERQPGEAVIFVGHGTDHPANMAYPALQYTLWRQDPNAFVATAMVEGTPSFADAVAELQNAD